MVLIQLALELFAPGGGEAVVAGAAVFGGFSPLGFDEASCEKTLQRGIQRAFFDLQNFFRGLQDGFGDFEAVHLLLTGESAENEHLQSAGRNFRTRRARHRT